MPAIASAIEEVGGIIFTKNDAAIALKRPTGVVDNFLTWDTVSGNVTLTPPVGSGVQTRELLINAHAVQVGLNSPSNGGQVHFVDDGGNYRYAIGLLGTVGARNFSIYHLGLAKEVLSVDDATGVVKFAASAIASPNFIVSGTAVQSRGLALQTVGSNRWYLYTAGPEAGANAGSDLYLNAYADDGSTLIGSILSIARASKLVSFDAPFALYQGLVVKNTPEAIRLVAGVSGTLGTAEWISWYRNDNVTRRALLGYQSDNDPVFWLNITSVSDTTHFKIGIPEVQVVPASGQATLRVRSSNSNAVLYLDNNLSGGHSSVLYSANNVPKWGVGMGTGSGAFTYDFWNYGRNGLDGWIDNVNGRLKWIQNIDVGAGLSGAQTNALIRARGYPNALEFGHNNTAGYGSTLGAEGSTGSPFIAFCAEGSVATSNAYMTRGLLGCIIRYNVVSTGILQLCTLSSVNADSQTATPVFEFVLNTGQMIVRSSGYITIASSQPKLQLNQTVGTGTSFLEFNNDGGQYIIGADNSVGNALTGVPYALAIMAIQDRTIVFRTAGANWLTLSNVPATAGATGLTCYAYTLGNARIYVGAAGTGPGGVGRAMYWNG